jgi:hypothetical protein
MIAHLESRPALFLNAVLAAQFIDQLKDGDDDRMPAAEKVELIDRALFACQPH